MQASEFAGRMVVRRFARDKGKKRKKSWCWQSCVPYLQLVDIEWYWKEACWMFTCQATLMFQREAVPGQ